MKYTFHDVWKSSHLETVSFEENGWKEKESVGEKNTIKPIITEKSLAISETVDFRDYGMLSHKRDAIFTSLMSF